MEQNIIDYANEFLEYNKETGLFLWKKKPRMVNRPSKCNPGMEAGSLHRSGYKTMTIKGRHVQLHRLAWILCNGHIATEMIDHINGIRHDNRLCNLRLATRSQNLHNSNAKKCSTTKIKNVQWESYSKKWRVRVRVNGTRHHVGRFEDINEAVKAASDFMRQHHGEFAKVSNV
jgi:hypothetical protein